MSLPISEEQITRSQAVGESMRRTQMFQSSEDSRRPKGHFPKKLVGIQTFTLDPDIALACEDQQKASGMKWEDWLNQAVNDALRAFVGF